MLILGKLDEVALELSESSQQLIFYSLQWENVVCLPVISLLVGLLFIFRLVQSVRICLYIRCGKQLAEILAAGIGEKGHIIDKLCEAKEEYIGIESSFENARLEKESFNVYRLTHF